MALAKLTRLKAVNRILRAAGQQPVSSLTSDGVNDTSLAEDLLDETTLALQLEAPACAVVMETRNPTTDGFIYLPNATVSVDTVDEDTANDVTMRGHNNGVRLFSITDNSYVFDAPIKLKMTIAQEFDDLTPDVQFWIADHCSRVYQMMTQGDPAMDAMLGEIERGSRIRSRAETIRQQDRSPLNTPGGIRAVRRGWGQSGSIRRI